MRALALLTLAACALPHVDPKTRMPEAERLATVRVDVDCSEPAPFKTGEPGDPHQFDPDIVWIPHRVATGVVISERHVLTAAHAVFCPTIPTAVVTFADGEQFLMEVERDDAVFGSGTDVARLRMATDGRFHRNIPPPELGSTLEGGYVVAATLHGLMPGTFANYKRHLDGMTTHHGDSGAGVYTMSGQLIGIVVAGADDGSYTKYEPVGMYWLEGT